MFDIRGPFGSVANQSQLDEFIKRVSLLAFDNIVLSISADREEKAGNAPRREAPLDTIYQFGPFRFDSASGLLFRGAEELALPPKVASVLIMLLETPGKLVLKEAFLDSVWTDAYVADAALIDSIRHIRRALGDDPKHAMYIQTLHRRGYRFVAEVTLETTKDTGPRWRSPLQVRRWWRRRVGARRGKSR